MTPATCRTCHARVTWARTEKGRAVAVDFEPSANGHLVLELEDPRDAPIARPARKAFERKGGAPRYAPHECKAGVGT